MIGLCISMVEQKRLYRKCKKNANNDSLETPDLVLHKIQQSRGQTSTAPYREETVRIHGCF